MELVVPLCVGTLVVRTFKHVMYKLCMMYELLYVVNYVLFLE